MDTSLGSGPVQIVFWGAMAIVVYTYLGYPLFLSLLTRRRAATAPADARLPSVSIVVAAFNEETWIGRKIENLLRHDYPHALREVIVVSDGSTDATDAIVARFDDPAVRLLRQPRRSGKNAALNRGSAVARGDVLVFTDANALLAPGALRRLVAPFADPVVGLVSGQGLYGELGNDTARVVSNAYVRYESFLKQREAILGFVAAADGALYAMRRELYRELPSHWVHDLMHPIDVALGGRRSRFEPDAFTVEPPSSDAGREFQRHIRIIAQGFVVLLAHVRRLLAAGCLKELWMLVSHRALRWTSAVFLLAGLATNLALVREHPIYGVTLSAQLAFYALALAGAVAERLAIRVRILAVPYYFCVVSAAGIGGFWRFLAGSGHTTWQPTGGR
jgi:cellulose synthase/poly-beta-1,6-N-acetylglucosamine synthase-like glycosyltransferase